MGTALTDRQLDALKRLAPKVLLCQDPDAAGQEAVAEGKDAIDEVYNEGHHLRGLQRCAWCGCRPGRTPPTSSSARAPRRCARCWRRRCRSRASRSSGRSTASRLDARGARRRAAHRRAGRSRGSSPARSSTTSSSGSPAGCRCRRAITQEALRQRPAQNGRGGSCPAPPARGDVGDKREDTERGSSPAASRSRTRAAARSGDGHRRDVLRRADRRAAHYLAEHLDHPGQSLPPTRRLAKLVAAARHPRRRPRRRPAALTRAAPARQEPAGPGDRRRAAVGRAVAALAGERQRVHDEIRHRLRLGGAARRARASRARASRCARSTARTTSRGRHPDEAEPGVVRARGVEVDRPHLQDPLDERLLGVDVLHALDARLLRLLGEIPWRMCGRSLVIT